MNADALDPTVARGPSLKDIFLAARELTDVNQQKRYLDEVVGDDQELRQRVEQMLAAQQGTGASPLADVAEQLRLAECELDTPERINISDHPMLGPYKLLEEIGRGGMGAVYMAQQTHPIKRKVALKVIKPGMDTREVIARFEAERQALAMMDHPHIAKVLDAGTTPEGRPYFVMELVRGVPLTEFCNAKKLALPERLKLFVNICQAVQHAHQKGIIHRDLKPSNLLVTLHDGVPVVKVIDFGVAKALNQELTERTLFTQFSQMIGTPLYMAPEQAEMSGLDIDTRSDIYSLGVVLYELLTGTTPFDRNSLSQLCVGGVRKLIKEHVPQRPSVRISTLRAKDQSTIEDRRRLVTEETATKFRQELDWIAMKAMEKDRERRYESANALAADIERYLNDEPVQACPPSMVYLLQKFAKRNKGLLTAAALLLTILTTSTIVSLVFAVQASKAQAAANKSAADAKGAQQVAETRKEYAEKAQQQAVAAKEISETNLAAALNAVDKLLEHASNPELLEIPKLQPILKDIVADSLEFYDKFEVSKADAHEVRFKAAMTRMRLANMTSQFGDVMAGLALYENAIAELDKLAREVPDDNRYGANLAIAVEAAGWIKQYHVGLPAEAQKAFERALEIDKELTELFPPSAYTSNRPQFLMDLAVVHKTQGHLEKHRALVFEVFELTGESTPQLAALLEDEDAERAAQLWLDYLEMIRPEIENSRRSKKHYVRYLLQAVPFFRRWDIEKANEMTSEAFQIAKQIITDFPDESEPRHLFSLACLAKFEMTSLNDPGLANQQLITEMRQFPPACVKILHERYAEFIVGNAEPDAALSGMIKQFPTVNAYYRYRGIIKRDRGEYDDALADFNTAINLISEDGQEDTFYDLGTYVSRGLVFFNLKEYEKALADYDFAIEKMPIQVHWNKRRSFVHFLMENYDQALADIERSLEVSPDDSSALTRIPTTQLLQCTDRTFRDGLIRLASKSLASRDRADVRMVRASLRAANGDYAGALLDYDRVLELDPNDYECRTWRVKFFGERERWDDLKAELQVTREIKPNERYYIYLSALVAIHSNDMPNYRKHCQKLLNVFADSNISMETYFTAWTCSLAPESLDDYSTAIKLARQSVDTEHDKQQYLVGLGAILMRAGEFTEAKKHLDDALEATEDSDTNSSNARYFLAMTEFQLGNLDAAQEQLTLANESALQELAATPAWNRKLTLNLLRSEAETLLKSPSQSDIPK
ncbi:serine/threonine-protein kinase [Novipirellula artificiosorum]|uniref:Serine/threonine-protein kinase PknB n=1 Tax=Novipirellula artificiosorum TaxID=2528016 RepID=A0A5C6DAD7_9BACT|nr:serine/threonine-protein kinase [Novipirellula artificiosorum]TWU33852.1 Serine/threonine-protein kinase PknB [Novipirellula artificiosorum]